LFSDEKLSEIRSRISISDLVSEHVQLKKTGKNYKGLCPFHSEKSPSFIVSPDRDTFHCFGCGSGGNLFHFLMKLESLSFPEAVERLADRAGVTLDARGPSDPAQAQRRQRAMEMQRQAAWYYHCLLKKSPQEHPAWTYLAQRQVPREMVETFHLGYCPPQDSGLRLHLKKKGFLPQEIEDSGLYRKEREFYRGRLIFPIFRGDNKVVGMGGRLINEKDFGPKYLNSGDSEIFKKGELFYGLHLAKNEIRKRNQVIIVEGYLDVIALHAHGYPQAVAPLGTALTQQHGRNLKKFTGETVLLFDGDAAGEEASRRALEILLAQAILPTALRLDSGEDPDSFLRRYGRLAFEKKLSGKRNLLEELIDKWSAALAQGPSNLEKKGQTARQALNLIQKIPDSILQNLYRRRLAEALEIPEDWLQGLKAKAPAAKSSAPVPRNWPSWLPEEEVIFEVWLKFPAWHPEIASRLAVDDFSSPEAVELARVFLAQPQRETPIMIGEYFDLAPSGKAEVLSELALRVSGLEDEEIARESFEQAALRLQEKALKRELKSRKGPQAEREIQEIHEKIHALSQVIKNKERIYGERKNQ